MPDGSDPITAGNVICFNHFSSGKRIYLRADGEIDLSPGIEPNVWTFTARADELPDLDEIKDGNGILEFYNLPTAADEPALTIVSRIVDIELLTLGVAQKLEENNDGPIDLANQQLEAVEYRLMIADFRAKFKPPRGGILTRGQLNKKPLDEEKEKDANGYPIYTNTELATACFDEMGFTVAEANNALIEDEAFIPPTLEEGLHQADLDWLCAAPATELVRILKNTSHDVVPLLSGAMVVIKPGTGADPKWEDLTVLSNLPIGSIDRRSTKLKITSAPNAVRVTRFLVGINPKELQYAWYDPRDGKWKAQHEIDFLINFDLAFQMRNDWFEIPKVEIDGQEFDYKGFLEANAFRCIRVDPEVYGPVQLLHFEPSSDPTKRVRLPAVFAKIPVYETAAKLWRNPKDYVRCTPLTVYDNGRVLYVEERLMKLVDDVSYSDPRQTSLVPLGAGDMTARLTWEDRGANGAKCFEVGFEGTAESFNVIGKESGIEQFEPEITVSRPELILYRENDEDVNYDLLVEDARKLATQMLPSGKKARRVTLSGFLPINLSDRISKVRWTQTPPQTIVDVDDFASLKAGGFKAAPPPAGVDAERKQVGTAEHSGASTPIMPASPKASSGTGIVVVKLAVDGGSNGGISTPPTWTYAIIDDANKILAAQRTPTWGRSNGLFVPATIGLARSTANGLELIQANEIEVTGDCVDG